MRGRRKKRQVASLAVRMKHVAEVDALPGIPEEVWEVQRRAAVRRMAIIDAQPSGWRGLLNDFPHPAVAEAAEQAPDPARARRLLERRFGKPL